MNYLKSIFLLVVILSVNNLTIKAQDTIFLHNEEKIISEIIEVNKKEIKYKNFTKSDTTVQILNSDLVLSLHFKDGTIIKDIKELLGSTSSEDNSEMIYINDVPVPNKSATRDNRKVNMHQKAENDFYEEKYFQIRPGQTYKTNKHLYNPRYYVPQYSDPYNPALAGIVSFFIPGAGQMISGEVGRGLGFLGGYIGSMLAITAGAVSSNYNPNYYDYNSYSVSNSDISVSFSSEGDFGKNLMIAGLISMIGIHIWSIVDAVKVAKVNNMYFQDLRENYVSISLKPYVSKPNLFAPTNNQAVGLSLSVNF